MPGFALQNDPPKGLMTDLARGSFRDTQSMRGHLHASSSPVSGTSKVRKVRFGPCGLWPQPLTPSLKPFGVESYRGLSLPRKLLLGERTSKEMENLLQKTKALLRWCPRSKKATLQTFVTRHRVQPFTLFLLCTLRYLVISQQKHLWFYEVYSFPEIIHPLSAQRLCHLIRRAQVFFSQSKNVHISPDEAT